MSLKTLGLLAVTLLGSPVAEAVALFSMQLDADLVSGGSLVGDWVFFEGDDTDACSGVVEAISPTIGNSLLDRIGCKAQDAFLVTTNFTYAAFLSWSPSVDMRAGSASIVDGGYFVLDLLYEADRVTVGTVTWTFLGFVPEPGTLALLCLGLAGLALSRRRSED